MEEDGIVLGLLTHLFRRSKPQPRRLQLESLEQRAVLSTFAAVSLDSDIPPLYKEAPALAAATGTIVNVSTETALQSAIENLQSNTTILIAPGTYYLSSQLHIHDVDNVSIRGASGNRNDVVLVGRGMTNASFGSVPSALLVRNATNVLVADLTIRDVWYHCISLNEGVERPRLHNLHLVNAGEQFIKANPDGNGGGVDGGIVEYCLIEYSTTAKSDYTNGVDVHTGDGWIIRDNVFRNIRAPAGQLAGPAILVWHGSSNTVTSGNLFLDVQRAIHYGLLDGAVPDHSGGSIHNNFIYRSSEQDGDVGIGVFNSPDTDVLHNTIMLSGTYPNAIEYRFAGSSGLLIANNLTDAAVVQRDGAAASVSGNLTSAQPDWFVDAAAGDLHLASTAPAIDAALSSPTLFDYDGQPRPSGPSADVGADEFGPLNHAPDLDTSLSPSLYPYQEDTKNPAGSRISRLLGGMTDVDQGALQGIAITWAGGTSTGKWQYTLDGGTSWKALGAPTAATARLLPATDQTRIRYVPNANFNGEVSFSFRAWDQTQGASGGTFDLSQAISRGGYTAFSNAVETATLTITAVNDAPLLGGTAGSTGYQLNSSPIQLAAFATVSDIDSTNFNGGRLLVQVSSGADAANRLEIRGTFFTRSGSQLLHNGLLIGTIASDGVGLRPLKIDLTSHATPWMVQQLVRSVYFRTWESTSTATRGISFSLSDGDGGVSATRTRQVLIS
jgi:hypothetical protein